MILRPEIKPTDGQEVIDYYLARSDELDVLTCDKCGEDLAIEIKGYHPDLDSPALRPNDNGYVVIPVSDKLLASRVRLDGLCGYQCVCGNDTRANPIEEAASPAAGFMPHEIAKAQQEMSKAKWKPLVKQEDNKQRRETFTAERIK